MDTTQIVTIASNNNISIWLWIALAESIIIVLLILELKKNKQLDSEFKISKSGLKSSSKDGSMQNLVDSFGRSRELYKELSRKYHPDRFIGSPSEAIAKDLFQEISRHKRNYYKLLELKKRGQQNLNINP